MSQADSRRPVRSPATASRVFSGEAVVITPGENMLRMFNAAGSRIWELADGSHTVDEIVAALVDAYVVEPEVARADVESFIEDLAGKGLLVLAE